MTDPQLLHETDLVRWSEEQARLLRESRVSELDIENIAEEIESIGRGERFALWDHLHELLLQRLKWRYAPHLRDTALRVALAKHLLAIEHAMGDSPSLHDRLPDVMAESYRDARRLAEIETGLAVFPQQCPWTFGDAMTWAEEP